MRNSIATKEIHVVTKVDKNHKRMSQYSKECCNKVEELEEETSVITEENYVVTKMKKREPKSVKTKKFMSRQNSEQ